MLTDEYRIKLAERGHSIPPIIPNPRISEGRSIKSEEHAVLTDLALNYKHYDKKDIIVALMGVVVTMAESTGSSIDELKALLEYIETQG